MNQTNFSNTKNYVEFYFSTCFYEVFIVENSSWETNLNGQEITEILELLDIKFDQQEVINKYKNRNNHDVEVFHSQNDEQVFVYFDLEKDSTDQNDMFYLGIRCHKNEQAIIFGKLLSIYGKLMTSSPFSFDVSNNLLYNKVFKSSLYFYNINYNFRKLNHHNLSPKKPIELNIRFE